MITLRKRRKEMDKPTIKEYINLYNVLFALCLRLNEVGASRLRVYLQFALFHDYSSEFVVKEKRRVTLDVVEARYKFNEAFEAFLAHPFSKATKLSRKDVKRALKRYLRIDVTREDGNLHVKWV